MSVTEPTAVVRPERRPEPAPEHPVEPTGGQAEINALVALSRERRLSPAEGMRLAALSWTPDVALEHARLVRDRAPDLFALVKVNDLVIAEYDRIRSAAQLSGRVVPEPDEATLVAFDAAADELRAAMAEAPPTVKDVNRQGRAAFRAAIRTDWTAGMAAFTGWLVQLDAIDAHSRRLALARAAVGLPAGHMSAARPGLVAELDASVDGSRSIPTPLPPQPVD